MLRLKGCVLKLISAFTDFDDFEVGATLEVELISAFIGFDNCAVGATLEVELISAFLN